MVLSLAIKMKVNKSSNFSSLNFFNIGIYFFPFFSKDVVDMEVQENVIGAVIGPAGRSIVELQQFSGARIQVSKKGALSPGTR